MNISLHIERLVLDGLDIGPGQGEQIKAAVETELSRLLETGGLHGILLQGTALANLKTAGMQVKNTHKPADIGKHIAQAVYRGIGK